MKRKVMSLLEKVEVLDKLVRGMRTAVVGQHFDVNKLMINFIKRKEDSSRGSVQASVPLSVKTSCKMGRVLCV
jgi:hypothetical protein